ncbi:MAG: hypothetical protein AVDCRST_MAG08-3558, partial [uncultured Acetobacteraceae bacterium]
VGQRAGRGGVLVEAAPLAPAEGLPGRDQRVLPGLLRGATLVGESGRAEPRPGLPLGLGRPL